MECLDTTFANFLFGGNYFVEITDNNGCVKVATFEIGQNPAITSSFNVSQCDPYTWGSNFYTASGTYQQIFSAVNGCDSLVTLKPGSTTVSFENEADGVYFVLFDSNRSIYKVVKQ